MSPSMDNIYEFSIKLMNDRSKLGDKKMATNKTNDQKFKEDVLESKEPVLVDFWAEWCGPCKAIGPSLEELSEEMASKLKIVKINVDENPSTSQAYGIRSIPALMIFKDGQKISEKMGALPKSALESWVNETI